MKYSYCLVEEKLCSPWAGDYVTYGIEAWRQANSDWELAFFFSDICTDELFVKRLAERCTKGQLDPIHLPCVVEDALAQPELFFR